MQCLKALFVILAISLVKAKANQSVVFNVNPFSNQIAQLDIISVSI